MKEDISVLFKFLQKSKKINNHHFDNTIHLEKNSIYFVDLTTIYRIELNEGEFTKNFVITKEELDKIKNKSTKYYLSGIGDTNVQITTENKTETKTTSILGINRTYDIQEIVNTINFTNEAILDGAEFVKNLSSFEYRVDFYYDNGELTMLYDDVDMPITAICKCETIKEDNIRFTSVGDKVAEGIKMLGLTKKNNLLKIKFNEDFICLNNGNVYIYLLGVKEKQE